MSDVKMQEAPAPAAPARHLDFGNLLSGLILLGITAASIFVKNPARHAQAVQITDVVTELLPLLSQTVDAETQK